MADFEWDPEKEKRNIEKHKVDFRTASRIWEGSVLERERQSPQLQRISHRGIRASSGPSHGGHLHLARYCSTNYLGTKGKSS
jgi:uncharacterized DUF497 family protein